MGRDVKDNSENRWKDEKERNQKWDKEARLSIAYRQRKGLGLSI